MTTTPVQTDEMELAAILAEGVLRGEDDTLDLWAHQCHAASLAVVKAEVIPSCRVARGSCQGVGGQHSWIVVGNQRDVEGEADCYEPGFIIDPTLWSYRDDVEGVWVGQPTTYGHVPQQSGNIMAFGRPNPAEGEPIELAEPDGGWSRMAKVFLDMLGPLDEEGWRQLAHFPMEGWPSREIITQLCGDLRLRTWVPIDIEGMLTDLNPSGLYLPGGEKV